MNEREELLQLHDLEQGYETNLNFRTLVMVYLAMLVALVIFLPKIYIANNIYYLSRDVSEISGKRDVLLEENRALRSKLENLRYKNQILNISNPKKTPEVTITVAIMETCASTFDKKWCAIINSGSKIVTQIRA